MLSFNELYNISQGIFLAFKNNSKVRQLTVSHSEQVRTKFKYSFPSRFETFTKENFVLTCLYINFKKSPSSFQKVLDILIDIDFNVDVLKFKDVILNYKHHLNSDINILREKYGNPTKEEVFQEYLRHNIQFYTLWFYLKYTNQHEDSFTHIQQININKIKTMLLYVTFSEKSLLHIQDIFNESSCWLVYFK